MQPPVKRYVRYERQGAVAYGILEGDGSTISAIEGDLFGGLKETGQKIALSSVRLLWPCEPSKILAWG